jgi:DNA-binding response OmpR family regulator
MAKILVIDDEPAVRTMLKDALEPEHTILEAGNGIEAMKVFAGQAFDLVITDIIMPDQEGIETIVEIRKLKPGQKIIAMSGGGRTKTIEFLKIAERLGANQVLKKPFGPRVVRDAVRAVLRG